jgi:hypothetical protein
MLTEQDLEAIRQIVRDEIEKHASAERARWCTYPGCTIVDPPNGGHDHIGWNPWGVVSGDENASS